MPQLQRHSNQPDMSSCRALSHIGRHACADALQAVKDVYLPNSGLWVSEYPHCDRTQFLEVSLQVGG